VGLSREVRKFPDKWILCHDNVPSQSALSVKVILVGKNPPQSSNIWLIL
jgi:hypothetical protein